MWPWKEKKMSDCCCTELLWLKHLKPRFDELDEKIETLISAHEAIVAAQARIDAVTAKLGLIADAAEASVALPEPQ